jgi:hypothetical protein
MSKATKKRTIREEFTARLRGGKKNKNINTGNKETTELEDHINEDDEVINSTGGEIDAKTSCKWTNVSTLSNEPRAAIGIQANDKQREVITLYDSTNTATNDKTDKNNYGDKNSKEQKIGKGRFGLLSSSQVRFVRTCVVEVVFRSHKFISGRGRLASTTTYGADIMELMYERCGLQMHPNKEKYDDDLEKLLRYHMTQKRHYVVQLIKRIATGM